MNQDAILLLKKDHEKVKGLLEELADSSERATKRRVELLQQIDLELEVHTRIEEEIFYPAFKDAAKKKDDQKLYFEAVEEHRAAKMVLSDLRKTDPGSVKFGGRAKVLKELVTHHADEEEDEMFPHARKVMSKAELNELGTLMAERKQTLIGAAKSKARPRRAA